MFVSSCTKYLAKKYVFVLAGSLYGFLYLSLGITLHLSIDFHSYTRECRGQETQTYFQSSSLVNSGLLI